MKKEKAKRIAKRITAFAAAAAMAATFTFPTEVGDGIFEGFGNAIVASAAAIQHNVADGDVNITAEGDYEITGTSSTSKIIVDCSGTVNIKLDTVTITASYNGNVLDIRNGIVNLELDGNSILQAHQDIAKSDDKNAVHMSDSAELHIYDADNNGSIKIRGTSHYYGGGAAVRGGSMYIHSGNVSLIGGSMIMGGYGNSFIGKNFDVSGGSVSIAAGELDETQNGSITVSESLVIGENVTFTIPNNGSINVGSNAVMNISGTLVTNGSIENSGKITNTGYISASNLSTITNSGEFVNDGTITNNGSIVNNGEISGTGTINHSSNATLSGSGTYSESNACKHEYGAYTKVDDANHELNCPVCSYQNNEAHTVDSHGVCTKCAFGGYKCGDNAYAAFDADTGMLTIYGSDSLYDYHGSPNYEISAINEISEDVKSINVENGITDLGALFYFVDFDNLESISIPESVTAIINGHSRNNFVQLNKLNSISVDENNTAFSVVDNVLYNKEKTKLIRYLPTKSDSSYTIPNGVDTIDTYAFYGCTSLESIDIPSGVNRIYSYTFYGCKSLTNINIPNSVTVINMYAFEDCTSLTSVTIPQSVTRVDMLAFRNCTSLTNMIVIGSSTLVVPTAVLGCTSFTTIFIPEDHSKTLPTVNSKVRFAVDSNNNARITSMELVDTTSKVDIPEKLGDYPVIYVAEEYRQYVGNHTCAGGTATCTEQAECGLCGQEYGEMLPHSFTTYIPDDNATCTENGTETAECDNCDATDEREITDSALGHDNTGEWQNNDDEHWKVCARNGCDEILDIEPHSFDDGVITIPATEEAEGVRTYTCETCGHTKTEPIAKLDHTHKLATEYSSDAAGHWHTCSGCTEKVDFEKHTEDSGTVTVEPTETTEGVKTFKCVKCEYVMRTETIPAIVPDHTHEYGTEWKSDSSSHWHECSCGDKADIGQHISDGGVITVQPTAISTGLRVYSCSVCGYVLETETIPATGYNVYPSYPTYPTYPFDSSLFNVVSFTDQLNVTAETEGNTVTLKWDKVEK
ncbi:MAG: leucine-rich repeat protein, partial [Oscillospiraceae bacterium]